MDKLSKKTISGRIAAIVSIAVLIAVLGTGIFIIDRDNRASKLQIENIYQENLYTLSESLSNIEINMSKLLISNNNTETAVLLNDTYHHTQTASRALGVLPITQSEMLLYDRFLNQLGDWCSSSAKAFMAEGGNPSDAGGDVIVVAAESFKNENSKFNTADLRDKNIGSGNSAKALADKNNLSTPAAAENIQDDQEQTAEGASSVQRELTGFDDQCEELFGRTLRLNAAVKQAVEKLDGSYRLLTHMDGGFLSDFNLSELNNFGAELGGGSDINRNNEYNMPQLIYDGPFSDGQNKKSFKCLEGKQEISESQAIKKAEQIFADMGYRQVNVVGQTSSPRAYLLAGTTNKSEMFVSISLQGGMVISASVPCDNTGKKNRHGEERAKELAVEYAKMCGYDDDLKPVWYTQAAGYAVVNLTPEKNGIIFYPDLVKVKVCLVTGDFAGIEAMGYCSSCCPRDLKATVSQSEAQKAVSSKLNISGVRLALIPKNMKECLCYEFAAEYKGLDYFVYIDASTGKQTNIMRVMDGEQGKIVM